jgi:alkylhydroperoxidase family enzyme
MHTSEARARGETEARLYLLDAWHESPLYSERERAALAWTEAVTLVSQPIFQTASTTKPVSISQGWSWSI